VPAAQRGEDYIPALTYDRLTALYDPVIRVSTRERQSKGRLLEQAALAPGMRVLDLGCGTGTLAVWAKQRHPDVEIVGLDGDPEVLERGRRKAREAGVEVMLDEGLSFDLPYEDGSFDRVLSSLFFHHLKRDAKERTAREVARVLRPGGELHVADFGPQPHPAMWLLSRSVWHFDGPDVTEDNYAGRLPEIFTGAGLRDARERARIRTGFGFLWFYSARRGGTTGVNGSG
jgi:cyclopropane fatty-acyl-phospholipid synthase-like methyltransferase